MNRFTFLRLIGATALCLAAIGLGITFHLPALAAGEYQQFATPSVSSTCASTTPCLQWTNTGAGAGVEGISKRGNGSIGQTSFKSSSPSNGKAGVLGQDLSTLGGFDSGVLGTSTNGIGVKGTSTNSDGGQMVSANAHGADGGTAFPSNGKGYGYAGLYGHDDSSDGGTQNKGVDGYSALGTGVEGFSSAGTGTIGLSTNGTAVYGSSTNGTGMIGLSTNGTAIYGASTGVNGSGVYGESTQWIGVGAIGGYFNLNNGQSAPAISVSVNEFSGLPADVLDVCVAPTNPCESFNESIAELSGEGNLSIAGLLFTTGSCNTGCAKVGQPGRRVISYAPREAQPTMEDVGEAQLVSGGAYVRLEAKYASVIDQASSYFVFITPEGDCNQLYVTAKTADGFAVREARGGNSTVLFQYRIVARPYGDASPRLPDHIVRAPLPAKGNHHNHV